MIRRLMRPLMLVTALGLANGALLLVPVPARATSGCETVDGGCSGKCIDGTRQDCFACSGLCWVCGESC